MKNQFMRAEEVARELEVSRSYAYRLIRQLNAELREKGYRIVTRSCTCYEGEDSFRRALS